MLVAVLTLICWGTWINTMKLTGKWRFELFYYDFSLGVLLTATLAAFTLGTMGADITFSDNLTIVRRLQIGYAALAGVVFNLGHMMLVGGATIAGISTAFPIAGGLALAVGMGWSFYWQPKGSPALLGTGIGVLIVAVVIISLAFARAQRHRARELAHAAQVTGKKAPAAKKSAVKGLVISVLSGLLMGSYFPLTETARIGDLDMGPYPLAFLFACGLFASTLLFNLYFINLPVQGEAISMSAYSRGTKRQHLIGVAGGAVWAIGMIANMAAIGTPAEAGASPVVLYAIGQSAAVIGMACGLLVWKDTGSSSQVRIMMWAGLSVLTISLALMIAAPLLGS
jgi:glucose uptake protein